eukprot:5423773-Prymnesium_polylepis.1
MLKDKNTEASLNLLECMARLSKKEEMLRARDDARKCLAAVEANDKEIKRLMKRRYKCTGYAFVTFNQYQVAQAVLQELPKRLRTIAAPEMKRSSVLLGGKRMRVSRPPEPEDVIWENLQYTARDKALRQLLTSSVALVLSIGGGWIIFAGLHQFAPGVTIDPVHFFHFLGLYLLSLLLIIGGHLVCFIFVPIMGFSIERPHSHGERERSIMLKLAIFQ